MRAHSIVLTDPDKQSTTTARLVMTNGVETTVIPLDEIDPPSEPARLTSPSNASTTTLPVTGLGTAILPVSVVSGALAILGAALFVLRRRAHS